jgi:hypothetical protein
LVCESRAIFKEPFYYKQKKIVLTQIMLMSHGSGVGIATGYGMNDIELGVPGGVKYLTSYRSDRRRCPPSLLSNRYKVLFPRE